MSLRMGKWKRQEGASAVEFAIILPVLVLIMFGIVEFSILLYNKQVVTNASREGARHGIVAQETRMTIPEIEAVVNGYCSTYLITFSTTPAAPVTTVSGYAPNAFWGTDLTVSVSYNYSFLVIPNVTGITSPFVITAQTIMRYE
jgi:Flp pilus assembly protein TadG